MTMRSRFKSRGFTLIELMIVVAIVAILAAIAYPSYQEQVRKSRRADAQAVLLEAAQWMERRFTENLVAGYDGVALPAGLTQSPKGGSTAYYVITVGNLAQNTFTLTATPQAAGGQNNHKCGGLTGATFNVNQRGQKGVDGAFDTPAIIQDCWR
ncbi:MAG: prepilin-type N-terminal cleavage/methylation domain-containing protein [Candidatus Competibacteraceae bacterium]|nr:MAG: prepilin-type N-terminal cleavage/methylation domain-containing protein [Candidatus Competibacteraceae bacterium]